MSKAIVVAVDGPAGSGKSSVSKAVARMLNFAYYDTGAAYRSLAWAAREAGVDLDSEDDVVSVLANFAYGASEDPDNQRFQVDGVDVTKAIRGHDVSGVVSQIARHPLVRSGLVEHFRNVIDACVKGGIVMEGRDITTVVAPEAQVRVLLTADEETRIKRRQAEVDGTVAAPQVAAALTKRDVSDQSVVDFMNAAPGVTVLDSTPLTFDQTVEAMLEIIRTSGQEGPQ
jgi:cytidylate kinase